MASYPYTTALRSTTPPLYYHRPENTAPAYYTVPSREVEGLRIPLHGDGAKSAGPPPPTASMMAHPRTSVSLHPSIDRSSVQRPPPSAAAVVVPPSPRLSGYAMPSVVNPYAATGSRDASSYAPQSSATAAGRWSYQLPQQQPQYPTVDPLTSRAAVIDAEEGAAATEEAALRAKLAELQMARKRQEDEQLYLSHGWAQMLENEERYYTEPLIDRRPDIAAREQQCSMLHDRLAQAEAQAQHAQAQLQATEYILRDVEKFEQERQRLQDGFQNIERRRREGVAKAERYFDVETKRIVEGNKVIRKLDVQLREMTRRGPLAQLQGQSRGSSASRMVTFAPEKSIVLDLGREESASSAEPATEESSGGLTNSYASMHNSLSANTAAVGFMAADEEDIGGTSIAFSFNDAKEPLLSKRRKVEIASM
ncbi:hypothetical protein ABB37_09170 [Leptomonas pyrrhocoris]|uniref:Kinetoplastid kinetochore protein 8 n=1 Tax=Leptomonas pyrrhocoris TaxID=157538 RepID=A0A0M9FRH0_LEPPY|nr:hypothetical protein ABB37_09170 [Leptomonas pyrrhocoris]XP_015652947.1 hypothetical protein ABB37_09170 [Leptomonas pyrrhocoris]KPA74507.1 hypothetical protein ABB37_09170 [Leptomonas pyrrhocoris]KPA74508.1 hypothetical protein ABB37_09170 [Leptomonas pyrrhocoris]|eukprot:XP_015652946.1 hypothetical protein ABB37_09170 [Leptomonas pyrrhocoris]